MDLKAVFKARWVLMLPPVLFALLCRVGEVRPLWVGFVVGAPLAMAMRAAMKGANLTVALSTELYVATLIITAVMCAFAALLSIVKVLRLDPASVFKA